jgi:hypothetical protein
MTHTGRTTTQAGPVFPVTGDPRSANSVTDLNGGQHRRPHHGDAGRAWLRNAMTALAVLAAAAAVVSWDAQYVMVRAARRDTVVAALEAGIPTRAR